MNRAAIIKEPQRGSILQMGANKQPPSINSGQKDFKDNLPYKSFPSTVRPRSENRFIAAATLTTIHRTSGQTGSRKWSKKELVLPNSKVIKMSWNQFLRRTACAFLACLCFFGFNSQLALSLQEENGKESPNVSFSREILPILADRCYTCHGPDEQANTSGLRLDVRKEALESIEPGDAENSELISRVLSEDPDSIMPPPSSLLKLSKKEKELLSIWINQGAKYEKHWAFKPIRNKIPVPKAKDPWCRDPIDQFVLRKIKASNLSPATEAEKWRWLRRVTFDLTGLPPTIEEQNNFFNDKSPNCYEKVVDRLLASPTFGEKMAVSWLDAARYADSYGYQSDQLSPTWPYRDWVVRAFNNNLPYDQFLTQQLAGDLLPNPTKEQILATGFNRLHRQTNEGGSVELEMRTEYVSDRVDTFGTSMLGLTLNCARCHDHKYDSISQKDYYQTYAFFNNIDEWGLYNDAYRVPTPSVLLPNPRQKKEMEHRTKRKEAKLKEIKQGIESVIEKEFPEWKKSFSVEKFRLVPNYHWTFDQPKSNPRNFPSETEKKNALTTGHSSKLVDSNNGKGLQLFGDTGTFAATTNMLLQPWERYTISFWLKVPKESPSSAILFHRQGGTDAGFHGAVAEIHEKKVRFSSVRFWPGNAISVETKKEIPFGQWVHLSFTTDGSGTADGMSIYVDGKPESRILRNNLTKSPGIGGKSGVYFGQRFRSLGLKNAVLDDLKIFHRPISHLEAIVNAIPPKEKGSTSKILKSNVTDQALKNHFILNHQKINKLQGELSSTVYYSLRAADPVTEVMVMKEMKNTRPAHLLNRGRYDAPRTNKNVVNRDILHSLKPDGTDGPKDRLGLAKWLTNRSNPLAARVAVNRFWQEFFGQGLVTTPSDFGVQGQPPTHPELLDFMAADFQNSGWDVKRLCKKIVLSSTYRQSSITSPKKRNVDPDNLLLARGPSRRLSAEMVRDLALHSSGLMNPKIGGPPVSPYQPPNLWRESNAMSPGYRQSVGGDLYRRSLYTVWKRTAPSPNMLAFDAGSRETCTVKRTQTNTPLQAMVLLNDVQFVEAAKILAENSLKAVSKTGGPKEEFSKDQIGAAISFAFKKICSRQPNEREQKVLREIFSEQKAYASSNQKTSLTMLQVGSRKPSGKVPQLDLYAMTMVTQAILNSDAAIWKR